MKRMYLDRLTKLANHLLNGKLGHKEFNFDWFNYGSNTEDNICGTMGCALGECPIIFKKHFKFAGNSVELKDVKASDYNAASIFFDISYDEARHLFSPRSQRTDEFGGEQLLANSSKEKIARHILKFVEIKKLKNQINELHNKLNKIKESE